MRNKRNEYFGPMDPKRTLFNEGQNTLTFRSERMLRIYASKHRDFADEVLIGLAEGEQIVDAPPRQYIRFESEGRIWMQQTRREQTFEGTDETYATLDRPAPLSPEMQMIQRMMMKNQRERDADRRAIEELRRERVSNGIAENADPAPAPSKVRDKQEPSQTGSEQSEGAADRQTPDASGTDAGTADGNPDIEEGDV